MGTIVFSMYVRIDDHFVLIHLPFVRSFVLSRLTNRSPFVDNESVENIRDVRLRQVDWRALSERSDNPQSEELITIHATCY